MPSRLFETGLLVVLAIVLWRFGGSVFSPEGSGPPVETAPADVVLPMDVYRVVLPWQQPVAAKSATPLPSKPSARLVVVGLIVALALGGVGW